MKTRKISTMRGLTVMDSGMALILLSYTMSSTTFFWLRLSKVSGAMSGLAVRVRRKIASFIGSITQGNKREESRSDLFRLTFSNWISGRPVGIGDEDSTNLEDEMIMRYSGNLGTVLVVISIRTGYIRCSCWNLVR